MSKITKVIARQIYDSRGNPTVEAEIFTKNSSALAICPSGASTGTYEAFEKRDKNFKLPYPLMNIINGGAHANNGLRIQEFMIRPDRAKNFSDAMRICFVVIKNLSKIIKSRGLSTSVGDEGGFAPMISNNNQALDLIVSAIKKSGFINGKDVSICLDVAANELFKKKKYSIHSKNYLSVNRSIQEYKKMIKMI